VFQLKTGNIDLKGLERIQGQLDAATSATVGYPGAHQAKLAERAFLVTTGSVTPPARDRLRAINEGNKARGLASVELVERENLIRRFEAAQESLVDSDNLISLLGLLTADGKGEFPVATLLGILQTRVDDAIAVGSSDAVRRALSDSLLATAYSMTPWTRHGNHLGLAQAWLTAALAALRVGVSTTHSSEVWRPSYDLALAGARASLNELAKEADGNSDLVCPDLTEPLVYPARALVVCGWVAGHYLSELSLPDPGPVADLAERLILRELPFVRVPGESAAPHLFAIARALEVLGHETRASQLVASWLKTLTATNQSPLRGGASPLPNPYHSVADSLLIQHGFWPKGSPAERFDGRVYTALSAVDWLALRNQRESVGDVFAALSRLIHFDVCPASEAGWLQARDDGALTSEVCLRCPSSWAELRRSAQAIAESTAGMGLAGAGEMIPYVGLLLPHRFNRQLSAALGLLGTGA
jgi:hypothetical protein